MRPTSGIERRHFATIDLPRNPVLPVTRMVLPWSASAITEWSLVGHLSVVQMRHGHHRRATTACPAERRRRGSPEPVGLARLAHKRRRAADLVGLPQLAGAVLRHDVDREARAPGRPPRDMD